MRDVIVGLAGVAASFMAFGLSQLADGFVGAIAYMLALLIAPVLIGVAIATAINRRLDVPVDCTLRDPRLSGHAVEPRHCCGCGAPMMAMDFAWVCHACDMVPARR